MTNDLHAVTGAFGYSGRYIARRPLKVGHRVITLTNSVDRPNPFGADVRAYPFNFDDPKKLTASLRGVAADRRSLAHPGRARRRRSLPPPSSWPLEAHYPICWC